MMRTLRVCLRPTDFAIFRFYDCCVLLYVLHVLYYSTVPYLIHSNNPAPATIFWQSAGSTSREIQSFGSVKVDLIAFSDVLTIVYSSPQANTVVDWRKQSIRSCRTATVARTRNSTGRLVHTKRFPMDLPHRGRKRRNGWSQQLYWSSSASATQHTP